MTAKKPEMRALGTYTSADLGSRVKEPAITKENPLWRKHHPQVGKVESIHHFEVEGERFTSMIVRVPRTETQVKKKMPDCREIRGPATLEIEVVPRG